MNEEEIDITLGEIARLRLAKQMLANKILEEVKAFEKENYINVKNISFQADDNSVQTETRYGYQTYTRGREIKIKIDLDL